MTNLKDLKYIRVLDIDTMNKEDYKILLDTKTFIPTCGCGGLGEDNCPCCGIVDGYTLVNKINK